MGLRSADRRGFAGLLRRGDTLLRRGDDLLRGEGRLNRRGELRRLFQDRLLDLRLAGERRRDLDLDLRRRQSAERLL